MSFRSLDTLADGVCAGLGLGLVPYASGMLWNEHILLLVGAAIWLVALGMFILWNRTVYGPTTDHRMPSPEAEDVTVARNSPKPE